MNFFKWAIENKIVDYIKTHYEMIENDMNKRNATTKKRATLDDNIISNEKPENTNSKTRKRREELSVSACKTIKKENVKIIVKFN